MISPRTMTRPVVVAVSQATRAFGSSRMIASRIASLTWSHILSGWPSVTDSEVNRYWARRRCSWARSLACSLAGAGGPSSEPPVRPPSAAPRGRRPARRRGVCGRRAMHRARASRAARTPSAGSKPKTWPRNEISRLERAPERERATEPVALALEREVGVRDRLLGQGGDDRLGLGRGHDPVVEALEDQDRARDPVGEVARRALAVEGGGLRIRPEQAVECTATRTCGCPSRAAPGRRSRRG